MKKIMIPTDFSEHSKNAARYAIELARQFKASLTLFHVFTLSPATVYPPLYSASNSGGAMIQDEIQKAGQQSKQQLKAFRDILLKDQKDPCCHIVQRGGIVSENINEFAQEKDFDLIVMSTHGSGSSSDYFISTNTWEVIQGGNSTVLAVPNKVSYSRLDHFAFACDFTETDFDSVITIIDIAAKFKAKVSVVHVKTHKDDATHHQMMHQFEEKIRSYRPYSLLNFQLFQHKDIQEGLNDFILKNKISVLAMVNRKHNLLKSLFHRSLTRKFAYHSEIPLLVFPLQKAQNEKLHQAPQSQGEQRKRSVSIE